MANSNPLKSVQLTAAFRRRHQLGAELLVQGVLVGQLPDLLQKRLVLAQGEIRCDALFQRLYPEVLQPCDLGGQDGADPDVLQWFTAPQLQAPPQQRGAFARPAACEGLPPLAHQGLEVPHVQSAVVQQKAVAVRVGLHQVLVLTGAFVAAQDLAQLVDVRLDGLACPYGRPFAP